MKKELKLAGIVFAVALVLGSCELKDILDLKFDLGPYNVEFKVGPEDQGKVVDDVSIIYHDIVKEVKDNNGDIDKLESVKLKSVNLKLKSGATSFNDLQSCSIYVKAPGMSEKKIAWLDAIPKDKTELTPNLTGDNLKDYLLAGDLTIRIEALLSGSIRVVTIDGSIVFTANL